MHSVDHTDEIFDNVTENVEEDIQEATGGVTGKGCDVPDASYDLLTALPKIMEKIKFRGKSHEPHDLKLLMGNLEHWARLYPKATFDDFISCMERDGKKKEYGALLTRIRNDMLIHDGKEMEEQTDTSPLDLKLSAENAQTSTEEDEDEEDEAELKLRISEEEEDC